MTKQKTCPTCKAKFTGVGALSRKDNETEICSQCGTNEAMGAFMKHKTTPLALTEDQREVLLAILDYVNNEARFTAAMEQADLDVDDDRAAYEGILDALMKG